MSRTSSNIADSRRLRREQRTIERMIRIYCQHHHRQRELLCDDCQQTYDYIVRRLERCNFGPDKPTCEQCPVHCYRRDMRAHVKQIMRFSGPRMAWRHPMLAVWHLLDTRRRKQCDGP